MKSDSLKWNLTKIFDQNHVEIWRHLWNFLIVSDEIWCFRMESDEFWWIRQSSDELLLFSTILMNFDPFRWLTTSDNLLCFSNFTDFLVFCSFILFNGMWGKKGHLWVFSNAIALVVDVSKDITYTELLDKMYETIDVDRFTFDLKFEVSYTMDTIPMDRTVLKNDVTFHIIWFTKNRKRFSLCVSLVSKEIIASSAYWGVCRAKNVMIEELTRFEPNKRHNC